MQHINMRLDPHMVEISYDPVRDEITIRFRDAALECERAYTHRTLSLALDRNRRIVSLTIRAATWHIPRRALDSFVPVEQYLTVKQAASIAGLAPVTIRNRILCAHLPATKRGREWLIHRTHLEEFLAGPRCREWDP